MEFSWLTVCSILISALGVQVVASVSPPSGITLEVMLVADDSMVKHYGDKLGPYLLDVFYATQTYFQMPELGHSVKLALTKLMTEASGLPASSTFTDINDYKAAFDNWQSKLYTADDSRPEHYDSAILLSRRNFTSQGSSRFGLYVCKADGNAILRDDGYGTAAELAFVVGSIIGLSDDQRSSNYGCTGQAMSGSIMGNSWWNSHKGHVKHFWSDCSSPSLQRWMERKNKFSCMFDEPQIDVSAIYAEAAGKATNAMNQCHLTCGADFQPMLDPLKDRPDYCQALRCVTRDTGSYRVIKNCDRSQAPYEGSKCDFDKTCHAGKCIKDAPNWRQCGQGDCNVQNARWSIGIWSQCCGQPTKTRQVKCVKSTVAVSDAECSYVSKPTSTQPCSAGEVGYCTLNDERDDATGDNGCPAGWDKAGDQCYRGWLRKGLVDAHFGDMFCRAQGALPAHIFSQQQNDLVQRLMNEGSELPETKRLLHIGLRYKIPLPNLIWGGLIWVDGTAVHTSDPRYFHPWGRGEGTEYGLHSWDKDMCTLLVARKSGPESGNWIAHSCSYQTDFVVCSRKAN